MAELYYRNFVPGRMDDTCRPFPACFETQPIGGSKNLARAVIQVCSPPGKAAVRQDEIVCLHEELKIGHLGVVLGKEGAGHRQAVLHISDVVAEKEDILPR